MEGALSRLLSEQFCGAVMAFSAGEGTGNLFGDLVVGGGGSITASSARSTPRTSSADRNQEQLPRLGQKGPAVSRWCLVCANGSLGHAEPEDRRVGGLSWVCPAVAELNAPGSFWGLVCDQL